MDEVQAKLAREREEWDRQTKLRQEERLNALRERMRERREREQRMREDLNRESEMRGSEYEQKRRAIEEELRKIKEREREILMRAEVRRREEVLRVQKGAQVSRAESIHNAKLVRRLSTSTVSTNSSRSSAMVDTLSAASNMLKAEELLKIIRQMNPELEARRQTALQVSVILSLLLLH